MYQKFKATSAVIFVVSIIFHLSSCVSTGVYGPYYNYSMLSADFISKAIQKSDLYIPYPNMRFAKIIKDHLQAISFDNVGELKTYIEQANAKCKRDNLIIQCSATRALLREWPKKTSLIGKPKIEKTDNINLTLEFELIILNNQVNQVNAVIQYQ